MKLTVENKRKTVEVLSFGSRPFFTDRKDKCIPHGFVVKTYFHQTWWIGSTRVNDQGTAVEYQFTCDFANGDWMPTATAAYQNVNEKLLTATSYRNNYRKGSNGALLIAVTYPSLQNAIREYFKDSVATTAAGSTTTPPITTTTTISSFASPVFVPKSRPVVDSRVMKIDEPPRKVLRFDDHFCSPPEILSQDMTQYLDDASSQNSCSILRVESLHEDFSSQDSYVQVISECNKNPIQYFSKLDLEF